MNFYPFHIGDYASATRHLTWEEDLAYRRLIDAYYTREEPIPLDKRQAYRLVCASTDEQREAVDSVLGEFFKETRQGYTHKRCDEEIAVKIAKSEKAARSAKARWDAEQNNDESHSERIANASADECERMESACEGNAPNPNPNPNPKDKTLLSESDDSNDDFEQFWTAYPKKQAKHDAAKAFRAAKLKPEQLQTVLQDIKRRGSSPDWQKDGGKFIPLPATYLRGKRWEDAPLSQPMTGAVEYRNPFAGAI